MIFIESIALPTSMLRIIFRLYYFLTRKDQYTCFLQAGVDTIQCTG